MYEEEGSIWNMDGAQFYSIFEIKIDFVRYLREWDLEGAYWSVRMLRMEIDAALKRKEEHKLLAEIEEEKEKRTKQKKIPEKEVVDTFMEEVTKHRNEFNKISNPTKKDKSDFYIALEEFYMHLCYIMKKHRMYFREGEDNRLAILRR